MKIINIKILNFKSVASADISPNDFNVNVGQNNHGKTNSFDALRWFFKGFDREETADQIKCAVNDNSDPVEVEITLSGFQEKIKDMDSTKAKNLKEVMKEKDEISIRRSTDFNDGKRREMLDPFDGKWKDPIGADRTWNEFLPEFEYVHTKLSLQDVDAYKNTSPIGQMLSGVLTAIIEKDPDYDNFRKQFEKLFGDENSKISSELNKLSDKVGFYLEKQFPDGTKINFKVENPRFEELLKNFQTVVHDGVVTRAEDKGDGMQRAVMLSIIQAYADFRRENGGVNNFVFFIDEAELHLHPSAQRALKSALYEIIAQGDQVFINTHSSILAIPENPNQKTFVVKKTEGITNISPVSEQEMPSVIFDLLGGSPTDLLLPSNMVIVEGYSDVRFIRKIVQRFYSDKFKNIQIAPANGDVNKQTKSIKFIDLAYECFKSKANPYSDRVIVIADGANSKNKDEYVKFKDSHKELIDTNRFFELPVGSIEAYYPDPYKKDPNILVTTKDGKNIYADEISLKISQEEFEKQMEIIYKALIRAKECSFGENK